MIIGLGLVFLGAVIIGILLGIYLVLKIANKVLDDDSEELLNAYCFQCEFQMPVKEKNGRLYCSNCGLHHGQFK